MDLKNSSLHPEIKFKFFVQYVLEPNDFLFDFGELADGEPTELDDFEALDQNQILEEDFFPQNDHDFDACI